MDQNQEIKVTSVYIEDDNGVFVINTYSDYENADEAVIGTIDELIDWVASEEDENTSGYTEEDLEQIRKECNELKDNVRAQQYDLLDPGLMDEVYGFKFILG